MKKLTPIDLTFLALEGPRHRTHMAAYQVFRKPAGKQRDTFVDKVVSAFRETSAVAPFNQKLHWRKGIAYWQPTEPDMRYHVRHLALPRPGELTALYDILAFLNSNQLDRALPLWECYVIDGLGEDCFAVFYKVHHALIDGMGALAMMEQSLNTTARSRQVRPMWAEVSTPPRKRSGHPSDKSRASGLVNQLRTTSRGLMSTGLQLAGLGFQSLAGDSSGTVPGFRASRNRLNQLPSSAARRFANCELPMETVKRIAAATDSTVNDVMMTVIDDALNQYLDEQDARPDEPLVSVIAMSFRTEAHGSSGNQASAQLVRMGDPDADIVTRLTQVRDSTSRVKAVSGNLPPAVRQLFSLFILGAGTLPEFSTAFRELPGTTANLLISNMVGPKRQLYLGGAPMVAFQGIPIVPPGMGLNISFASVHKSICLAVGAAPEAVGDPYRLTQLIEEAAGRLVDAVL